MKKLFYLCCKLTTNMTEQEIKLNILNKLGSAPLKYMDEVYQWVIGDLKFSNKTYFAGLSNTELCIIDNDGKEVLRTAIPQNLENILTLLKKYECRVLCENDSNLFIDFMKNQNETSYLVKTEEIVKSSIKKDYGLSLCAKSMKDLLGEDESKTLAIINLNKKL